MRSLFLGQVTEITQRESDRGRAEWALLVPSVSI